MGSYASKSAPTSRRVICETADKQHIAVDIVVLSLSRTFTRMYRDLGLTVNEAFPGVFPVKTIDSRVFKKVIHWCKGHRDQSLIVEKDPFTQECVWFRFTKYERRFFRVPVEELLELVMAALYLDISSLEHYGCQAIAARIKGKQPVDVRRILRQRGGLSLGEYADIRNRNPWLDPETTVHDPKGDVPANIHIPPEVLLVIFEKLPRADLERLQLVSPQFRDIIHGAFRGEWSTATCLKFCAVQRLRFSATFPTSDELLFSLLPLKSAWKNATVMVTSHSFTSQKAFEFAFTELLFCKKIRLAEFERRTSALPRALLALPAMRHCNALDLSHFPTRLK